MSDEKKSSGSGLSVQTLVISSIAAVAATVIVSQFWEKGTLIFTAMVPIAVALVTEALKRPAEKITQVAPLVVPTRRSATGTAVYDEVPGERDVPEEARRRLPDADPFGLYEDERGGRFDTRRWVRVGLVTGLIAFFVGAAAVTASELALFDGSVGGGERRTTIFGGKASDSRRDGDSERERERDPAATATPEAGTTPQQGTDEAETPDAEATPSPTPTATATPAPETTPPPAATPPPEEPDPAAP